MVFIARDKKDKKTLPYAGADIAQTSPQWPQEHWLQEKPPSRPGASRYSPHLHDPDLKFKDPQMLHKEA